MIQVFQMMNMHQPNELFEAMLCRKPIIVNEGDINGEYSKRGRMWNYSAVSMILKRSTRQY